MDSKIKQASDIIDANWLGSCCEDPMEAEKPNSVTSLPSPSTASEVSSPVLRPGADLNLLDDPSILPVSEHLMEIDRRFGNIESKSSQKAESFQLAERCSTLQIAPQDCKRFYNPIDCVSFASAVGKAFDCMKGFPQPVLTSLGTFPSSAPNFIHSTQPSPLSAVNISTAASQGRESSGAPSIQTAVSNVPYAGADWVTRRLRDRWERAGAGNTESLAVHMRRIVMRLRAALPTESPHNFEAQARLLAAVRRYIQSDATPEEFAEAIHSLVDDYQVIFCTPGGIMLFCSFCKAPIQKKYRSF